MNFISDLKRGSITEIINYNRPILKHWIYSSSNKMSLVMVDWWLTSNLPTLSINSRLGNKESI